MSLRAASVKQSVALSSMGPLDMVPCLELSVTASKCREKSTRKVHTSTYKRVGRDNEDGARAVAFAINADQCDQGGGVGRSRLRCRRPTEARRQRYACEHAPGQAACDLSRDPSGGGVGREGAGGVDAGRDGSGLPTRAALIRAWIQMGLL